MLLRTAFIFFTFLSHGTFAQHEDFCEDKRTGDYSRCTLIEDCQSAQEDWEQGGKRPVFCQNTTRSEIICCRKIDRHKNVGIKSRKKCTEYSQAVEEILTFSTLTVDPDPITIAVTRCEYSGQELIVGGEDAKQGEFPHMAAIGWDNLDGGYFFDCGGTLISSRFVLTVAHCTKSPKRTPSLPSIVRLGDHNLDSEVIDGAYPIEVRIKNIIKHPDYKPPQRYNDIALFELASKVDFNKYIRPACLWHEPDIPERTAVAIGWGLVNPVTKEKPSVLQKVSLMIKPDLFCNAELSNVMTRNWDHGFENSQICAGAAGDMDRTDTCEGDSGSPLQIEAKENVCIKYVIGITSFGYRMCGTKPAVYTRVQSYLDWIESIVWPV